MAHPVGACQLVLPLQTFAASSARQAGVLVPSFLGSRKLLPRKSRLSQAFRAGVRWLDNGRTTAIGETRNAHRKSFSQVCCSSGEAAAKSSGRRRPVPPLVTDLVDFLNAAWTPFHATDEAKQLLLRAGYQPLSESAPWDVRAGGKYFFTRNMSTIVAFALGSRFKAGNGFNIIAAHTDSPCPKLKPVSSLVKGDYIGVGVQTYGGGLWYTWFDRDLSVAGRVLVKQGGASGGGQQWSHRLVKIARPVMRIPSLAIHLDRTVNEAGFKPNMETHLAPVLATLIEEELDQGAEPSISPAAAQGGAAGTAGGAGAEAPPKKKGARSKKPPHHPVLLKLLAHELDCAPEDIVDFELNVCDVQPSALGGAFQEFIFSGRLDNLASSYAALRALVDTTSGANGGDGAIPGGDDEESCRMVCLFDHEEVGSNSAEGAGAPILLDTITRLTTLFAERDKEVGEGVLQRALRKSFLVSADMAHAVHPHHPDKHEANHQPLMHAGLVVKHNANQRYATNSVTAALFREVARAEGVPTQDFCVRNDMGCGSTIGPILASGIGIRTVDVGMPQLSMHSVREMCGTEDIDIGYRHFKAFYRNFTRIDKQLVVD
eukprot:jgi/Mesvir1/25056/Mv11900-RA.1